MSDASLENRLGNLDRPRPLRESVGASLLDRLTDQLAQSAGVSVRRVPPAPSSALHPGWIAPAVATPAPVKQTLFAPEAVDALTLREHEVTGLIVRGRTNHQIADELGISPRTVTTHVARIFSKLEVDSRRELRDRMPLDLLKSKRDAVKKPAEPKTGQAISEKLELAALTARERQVLELIVRRWTVLEIAEAIEISPRTVESHVMHLFDKFAVRSRRELIACYIRELHRVDEAVEDESSDSTTDPAGGERAGVG